MVRKRYKLINNLYNTANTDNLNFIDYNYLFITAIDILVTAKISSLFLVVSFTNYFKLELL